MKVKERISHFWNETLGIDCPEEINILDSQRPEDQDLKESLARVDDLEKKYKASSTGSSKGGKGQVIVEKIEVDSTKATKQAEQKAIETKAVESKEER